MSTVLLEIRDRVARVVLNRPAQLNAVSPELLGDLEAACEAAVADASVKVVTITGAGRAFCAGADLRAVESLIPDRARWAAFMARWRRVYDRIEALPLPVIAGVHGMALAGGLELVLVADLVVADEEARLGDQHANFGLVAGGGGSQRLPRVVGPRRAKEMMLLGGWIGARQALEWGLVNRVAPAGQLEAVVAELARELAGKSRAASEVAKALVNASTELGQAEGLDAEGRLVAQHMRSPEAGEGLRAFAEKRAPRFP